MLLFIDTEFSGFTDAQLISMGLISEDGRHEFYAERNDVPEADCSTFVRTNVLPLLGPALQRISRREFAFRLWQWLKGRGQCSIVVDYQGDWDLLKDLLGYRLPNNVYPKPLLLGELSGMPAFLREYYGYFSLNGMQEHHALHDARANRLGWLGVDRETRQRFLEQYAVGNQG